MNVVIADDLHGDASDIEQLLAEFGTLRGHAPNYFAARHHSQVSELLPNLLMHPPDILILDRYFKPETQLVKLGFGLDMANWPLFIRLKVRKLQDMAIVLVSNWSEEDEALEFSESYRRIGVWSLPKHGLREKLGELIFDDVIPYWIEDSLNTLNDEHHHTRVESFLAPKFRPSQALLDSLNTVGHLL